MNFVSIVKRVAPFALTLTIGLFIASFFVTVAAPNFQFKRGFSKHHEYHKRMKSENKRLREENIRLKNRLAEMEKRDWVLGTVEVPMNPPEAPKLKAIPMESVPQKSR